MKNSFTILTVSQLNLYVRSLLEADGRLSNLFLKGEISNFTNHYRSGHFYMTLKDENAAVKAVMFRSNAARLHFLPQNGMKVIAMGRVSLYERDGQYQFYIDDLQPDGVGALYIRYEQLREKLAGEGLFDEERKKPLPSYPMRIGVVTSPTGAALQDIRNILARRWPLAAILLYPVLVQGSEAPGQICSAIRYFNRTDLKSGRQPDVLIVGRGGGSLEELWAFNDEEVARTIASSGVPVISAVGHETDYTLADFAADLRAPTPSAAAELAVPDIQEVLRRVAAMRTAVAARVSASLEDRRRRLELLLSARAIKDQTFSLGQQRQKLDRLLDRLCAAAFGKTREARSVFAQAGAKLDALSPLRVLTRGYAIASDKNGNTVDGIRSLSEGDGLSLRFRDGTAGCTVVSLSPLAEGKATE
jgi:exodeoxyribonuclease VII large subunit